VNCITTTFSLVIGLVVVEGDYFELDLKSFQELLPEVQGKSVVPIKHNREKVFINCEYLVQ
jgi:hypothetical protein